MKASDETLRVVTHQRIHSGPEGIVIINEFVVGHDSWQMLRASQQEYPPHFASLCNQLPKLSIPAPSDPNQHDK